MGAAQVTIELVAVKAYDRDARQWCAWLGISFETIWDDITRNWLDFDSRSIGTIPVERVATHYMYESAVRELGRGKGCVSFFLGPL